MPKSELDIRPVCELITAVRRAAPQSVALNDGPQKVSFAELDDFSRRFAGHLQAQGVLPGDTVAICMERSPNWVIAALAVMRCGAAYLPLDSAWPDARVRFALQDSGATAVVARRSRSAPLQLAICSIDPVLDAVEISASADYKHVAIGPEDLAYVIYTSGSSGFPKGVEVTHGNLANLVQWHIHAFAVGPRDRASHLAGLGFDASVWEIWPNLCAGATVCVASEEMRYSPGHIYEWLLHQRITIAFIPTVHVAPLTQMPWPANTALRLMLTGGDTLHQAPPLSLPFALINNYGPAECTVVTTSGFIAPHDSGKPSIGSAILGAKVYLLDESMQRVNDGVLGEIYVGGDGVANGYRNLPRLTEQKFLPDPFSKVPNARMYRTGDFGVQRLNGDVEFRGRHDRQVKLRGQRIELDEIDAVLNQHPAVKFATAVLDESEGKPQLVAYVLPREEASEVTRENLQEHLQRQLPVYMIPQIFARIFSIPATINAKIDLRSFPPIANAPLIASQAWQRSHSLVEERLLAIVRDLLSAPGVTSQDNFFLSGGHSLLGMQLLIRLQEVFAIDLSLQDLFRSPTIERLATLVQFQLTAQALTRLWQHELEMDQIGIDQDLYLCGADIRSFSTLRGIVASHFSKHIPASEFLTAPTIRLQTQLIHDPALDPELPSGVLEVLPRARRKIIFWIHYQNVELAKAIGEDMTFLSVVLTPEDLRLLGESPTLQQVACRIVPKILETQAEGPYVIGGLCIGGVLAYEVAHQLQLEGRQVSLLVLLDPPTPAYLKLGPSPAVDLSYLRYLLQRAMRLGPKVSVRYFRERLARHMASIVRKESLRTTGVVAQSIIEGAAFNYVPAKYDGKVLLLLAAERPPSVNFLPGWQAVTTAGLNAQYVDAHHRDLLAAKSVQEIADAIKSRLLLTAHEQASHG